VNEETTDLEYREAAMRLAIQWSDMMRNRATPAELIRVAQLFEGYLRVGQITL
jgi:hypothetical protein